MAKELYQKENEALALQNLLDKEKLSQLCGQINPHFLFNTLNIIKIMDAGKLAQAYNAQISAAAEEKVLNELRSSGINVIDVPDKTPWANA